VNALNHRVKRFCKHVLYFEAPFASHPCNLKLKCNHLIFNEILVLYTLYVCLMHSRFIENQLIWILDDEPLIYEAVLSQLVSELDWG
jgi:hypothetical protein